MIFVINFNTDFRGLFDAARQGPASVTPTPRDSTRAGSVGVVAGVSMRVGQPLESKRATNVV
jgi:hypothetical protein